MLNIGPNYFLFLYLLLFELLPTLFTNNVTFVTKSLVLCNGIGWLCGEFALHAWSLLHSVDHAAYYGWAVQTGILCASW